MTIHFDEDLKEILTLYPEKKEQKHLNNFIGHFKKSHFYYAYKNILIEIRKDIKHGERQCYSATEAENAIENEFQQFKLASKCRFIF